MTREERLRNAVEAFNLKVDSQTGESAKYQPKKKNFNELNKTFSKLSTKEFQREISRIERYLEEGAEAVTTTDAGTQATVWEISEISNIIKSINYQNQKILKTYDPNTYKGTMHTIRENNLKNRKNRAQTVSQRNFKKYFQNLEKAVVSLSPSVANPHYKQNYLAAMQINMVDDPNRPEDDDLYRIVQAISPEHLVEMYYNNPFLEINFIYSKEELDERKQKMKEEFLANMTSEELERYYSYEKINDEEEPEYIEEDFFDDLPF